MQEVEDTAEDSEQQQTQYDHHYDHPTAFGYTNTHTDRDRKADHMLIILHLEAMINFFECRGN